jgi:hypothetical protein
MDKQIAVGDRVEAGMGDDRDTGRVWSLVDAGHEFSDMTATEPMALVGWDSLVSTWHPVSALEVV